MFTSSAAGSSQLDRQRHSRTSPHYSRLAVSPTAQRLHVGTKRNDISVEAKSKATVKEAKGSKLDSKTRAEWQSDVRRVEDWDTSAWPTWTVTGRVLPERCDVSVPNLMSHWIAALGRFQLRKIQVIRSHIVSVCALERKNPDVHQIADVVRSALWFPVDYIAFLNRVPTRLCWTCASIIKRARSGPSLLTNRRSRPRIPVSALMHRPTHREYQYLGQLLPYMNSQLPCTILPQPCATHAAPSSTVAWRQKPCGDTLTRRPLGAMPSDGVRAK
jgi:hypothetical protein